MLAHMHIKFNIGQRSRLQRAIQIPLYQVCDRIQAVLAQPACSIIRPLSSLFLAQPTGRLP